MRCFVKATKRYLEEAQQNQCRYVLEHFRHRAETDANFTHPSTSEYGFTSTDGKCHYLKKVHTNFRTIFAFQDFNIEGQPVRCYVALRVFCRGDNAYEQFHAHNTSAKVRDSLTGILDVDWNQFQNEIREELVKTPEIKPLPRLFEDESLFISNQQTITQEIFDVRVCESKEWVQYVLQGNLTRPVAVAEKLSDSILALTVEEQYGLISLSYGDGERILCYHLKEENADPGIKEKGNSWFLLEVGPNVDEEKWRKALDEVSSVKKFLQQQCHRAYPYSMLDDKDFWISMEKDKDSNFILSEEEMRVVSQPLEFPVFISGRAGSGKSTILQYLFAEFLLHYFGQQGNQLRPPVYLSYSENLIDNAKKLSKSLFKNNHAYSEHLQSKGKTFEQDVEPLLNKTFFEFQKIVRDCIFRANPEVLKKRFPMGRYITYSRFRKLWMQKFGRERTALRDYGPAISWHVIRTYIKGWDSEAYCDMEEYQDIGRKNQTVTEETFRNIFERVWERWYQPLQEKEGYWDDQDLVRYCLEPDDGTCETCAVERFSAIVCDEAQDFTRVETDFILRLSSFSHRTYLNVADLEKLPFIFAGDEFQTINPTGFSWSSLRSYFTQRLADMVGFSSGGNTPDPIPLTQNYRSTVQIVKLGNRLQLLRTTRCRASEQTRPQEPYFSENADSIYCLSPKDPEVWQKLKEMKVVLIIPSADGQSPKDFIENSPIKDMVDFNDDGSPAHLSIYNPIQVKGLEYPCVAIYGFDPDPKNNPMMSKLKLDELTKWYTRYSNADPSDEEEEKELELRYQLSNAYVAVTRAKNKLFILSDFDENSFWTFAYSSGRAALQEKIHKLQNQMISCLSHSVKDYWTEDMLGYVLEGEVDAITGDNIAEQSAIIQRDEERGISLGDASMLRQVAARYRERGESSNEVRCEAWASLFDGQYMAAGEKFQKAKLFDEAVSAFWHAYDQGELKALQALSKRESKRLEARMATLAVKAQPQLRELKIAMSDLFDLLSEDSYASDAAQECMNAWNNVFNEILGKKYNITKTTRGEVPYIFELAEKLETVEVRIEKALLAMLAFQIEDYKKSVVLWEKSNQRPFPPEYHQAQTKLLDYPYDLDHWEFTKDPQWKQRVIERYHSHASMNVEPKFSYLIGCAVLDEGTPDEKRKFLPTVLANAKSRTESLEALDKVKELKLNTDALRALVEVRWDRLRDWKKPRVPYIDSRVANFLNLIEKIQYIKTPEFAEELKKALSVPASETVGSIGPLYHVSEFMNEHFGSYTDSSAKALLLTELGAAMESRGHFGDCLRYYDWVLRKVSDPAFQREINIRIIACKEKQALRSDNKELILQEVSDKRRELGLGDKTLPQTFQIQNWDWYFDRAMQFSPDVKGAKKQEEAAPAPARQREKTAKKPSQSEKRHARGKKEENATPGVIDVPDVKLEGFFDKNTPKRSLSSSLGIPRKDKKGKKDTEALKQMAQSTSKSKKTNQAATETPKTTDAKKNAADAKPQSAKAPESAKPEIKAQPQAEIQSLQWGDYRIRFNRSKFRLTIDLDKQDLTVKFINGTCQSDDGFYMRGDRLMLPDGTPSPFEVKLSENVMKLVVVEGSSAGTQFPFIGPKR